MPVLSWSFDGGRDLTTSARLFEGQTLGKTMPSRSTGSDLAEDRASARKMPIPKRELSPKEKPTLETNKPTHFDPGLTRPPTASLDKLSPTASTLRANPYPEVTDPICRFPLPTFIHRLEAVHLGDLMRISVRTGANVQQRNPPTGFSRASLERPRTPQKRGALRDSL